MTKERITELRGKSSPTWEGLSLDSLSDALKGIDPEAEFEVCSGKEMNEYSGLRGSNAYPADLHIVILTKWSINMMDWKLRYGCRWLDDVCDNNERRERNKR